MKPLLTAAITALALIGASVSSASAVTFGFQYVDTVSFSNVSGVSAGDSATITVLLDNGGLTNVSQTWTAADLQSVSFQFGSFLTTFNSPFGGSLFASFGSFSTDGAGVLTSVMSSWSDTSVGTDFTTNGPIPGRWFLNGFNGVYCTAPCVYEIQLENVGNMLFASNWTPVAPVPIPAALPLLASALGVFGYMSWRRKTAAAS